MKIHPSRWIGPFALVLSVVVVIVEVEARQAAAPAAPADAAASLVQRVDRLFARRSSRDTLRLAVLILIGAAVAAVASKLFS